MPNKWEKERTGNTYRPHVFTLERHVPHLTNLLVRLSFVPRFTVENKISTKDKRHELAIFLCLFLRNVSAPAVEVIIDVVSWHLADIHFEDSLARSASGVSICPSVLVKQILLY